MQKQYFVWYAIDVLYFIPEGGRHICVFMYTGRERETLDIMCSDPKESERAGLQNEIRLSAAAVIG